MSPELKELKNPLMKNYMKIAGWDATGSILKETEYNKAPINYDRINPQENLAESMMLYLYAPKVLKEKSKSRLSMRE